MTLRFRRAPRRGRDGHQRLTFLLEREIVADPRFAKLGGPAQSVLLAAVNTYADAEGKFWPKASTLAELVGRSERSVLDSLRAAAAIGLLRIEPYLRPDGKRGSNTYYVDRALVTSAEETFLASDDGKEPAPGQDGKKSSSGQDGKKPAGLNEISIETLNGSSTLKEADICMFCRSVLADDEEAMCAKCKAGAP